MASTTFERCAASQHLLSTSFQSTRLGGSWLPCLHYVCRAILTTCACLLGPPPPRLLQVWKYEGSKTLSYYMRRRDTVRALAQDLGVGLRAPWGPDGLCNDAYTCPGNGTRVCSGSHASSLDAGCTSPRLVCLPAQLLFRTAFGPRCQQRCAGHPSRR